MRAQKCLSLNYEYEVIFDLKVKLPWESLWEKKVYFFVVPFSVKGLNKPQVESVAGGRGSLKASYL